MKCNKKIVSYCFAEHAFQQQAQEEKHSLKAAAKLQQILVIKSFGKKPVGESLHMKLPFMITTYVHL